MDSLVILILFWLGIFVASYSYKIGLGKFSSPGPGLFPFLLGCILFVLSLYRGIKVLKRAPKEEGRVGEP
ncbi:MAG: hypothetical protein ABIM21_01670, partial [candidate division WOR-3 bacterium]